MKPATLTIGARYIFPVEGPPIENGLLGIDRRKVAFVASGSERKADLDLGNVAITPGFVNAHTHLELSSLNGPGTAPGAVENEVQWLRRVVDQRRGSSEESLRAAANRNVAALIAAGTSLVADTTTAGLSWDAIAAAPLRAVVFSELIGLRRERGLQTCADTWNWLSTIQPDVQVAACARPGLSPHAPYSTSGWLYHRAAESRLPCSTHLAEMPEELELLRTRRGPLREFLESLGAWDDEWEPISQNPADYVRRGKLREVDWLVAHGTYLDPADFWQLRPEAAPNGQRVAIAFCPRTHARFGHAPHPYRTLLERGVIVCLGTDSLASSPTLSILDEVRFLRQQDPTLSGPLLLSMATLFGAWAMRSEAITGSLKKGKSADFAVIALPDRDAADPHELLFESELPVIASAFEGKWVSGLRKQ
jgi:cytosine/adenosine deaminase-related metal-dependent hydrolase